MTDSRLDESAHPVELMWLILILVLLCVMSCPVLSASGTSTRTWRKWLDPLNKLDRYSAAVLTAQHRVIRCISALLSPELDITAQ
jgi:ABC-type phosphate transport system permease subunit